MQNLNRVMLIGHLGSDIEVFPFESGAKVGRVSLATSKKYTKKDQTEVNETQWHNLQFWNKGAELMEKYTSKGSKIYVEGELTYRAYDQDGVKKYVTEIKVSNFEFLSKSEGSGNRAPVPTEQSGPEGDDDLPF